MPVTIVRRRGHHWDVVVAEVNGRDDGAVQEIDGSWVANCG